MNTCSNVILAQVISLDLHRTGPVLAGTDESAMWGQGGVRVPLGEKKGALAGCRVSSEMP